MDRGLRMATFHRSRRTSDGGCLGFAPRRTLQNVGLRVWEHLGDLATDQLASDSNALMGGMIDGVIQRGGRHAVAIHLSAFTATFTGRCRLLQQISMNLAVQLVVFRKLESLADQLQVELASLLDSGQIHWM